MRKKTALLAILLATVVVGFRSGPTVEAQEAAPSWSPTRVSTAALPKAWGQVRGVVGRDEITLILEDEAGTVRAVTLERAVSADGRTPAVRPRLFTIVPRQ